MDRKSIIVLVVSFVLLMVWYPLVNRIYPPPPTPPGTNSAPGLTNRIATSNTPAAPTPATPVERSTPAGPATALIQPNVPEELVTVETDDARFIFTSYGGGLKRAELKRYPESVACRLKDASTSNSVATLNTKAPVPALTLLGSEALQGDGLFTLTKTGTLVRAEKTLTNGLHIVKEFHTSTNYLLTAIVRFENRSAEPLRVPAQEWVIGTATPLGPHDDATLMGLQWYNGLKPERIDQAWFANSTLGCFPGTPRDKFESVGHSNVVWAAVHNQFFAMAAVPQGSAPRLVARRIDLPPPTREELTADPKMVARPFGYQAAFVYPEMILEANKAQERRYEVFAGPKEYRTLSRLGAQFANNLDFVMNFDGFFGWFAKALLLSMNGLHAMGLSYGLAIVAITVIIKILFWPLTQASTKSMKRMQALQPQMKALQEKYKDDPKKMNLKLMEFMKEQKVSPLGGCLPMLLQIPVFFGFFTMLRSAIELRGAGFLWACDLSQPDTLFVVPGLNLPFNLLPIIMTATQLWQTHLTPPAPGMDPMQQKIMKYMPIMFIVILYNFQSGLTLYWTVQNLLTIAQMKLTKNDSPPPGVAPKAPVAPLPKKKK